MAEVSHAPGRPCSNPTLSQRWRCRDEPCVQSSGRIVPVARCCRKSLPTTAAARSVSARSASVTFPRADRGRAGERADAGGLVAARGADAVAEDRDAGGPAGDARRRELAPPHRLGVVEDVVQERGFARGARGGGRVGGGRRGGGLREPVERRRAGGGRGGRGRRGRRRSMLRGRRAAPAQRDRRRRAEHGRPRQRGYRRIAASGPSPGTSSPRTARTRPPERSTRRAISSGTP